MVPTRSHSAHAQGFGRTARVRLLSDEEELSGFRVSMYAGAISSASAGGSGWLRCQQRTAMLA